MDPEHLHVRGHGGRRPGQLRGRQRRPAGRQGQEREVEPGRHHQLGHRLRGQVGRENIFVRMKIFDNVYLCAGTGPGFTPESPSSGTG